MLCFGGTGDGIVEAANDALLAEDDHGLKKWWRNGLPDNGHARGIDQQCRFRAACFSDSTRGMIASVVIPLF